MFDREAVAMEFHDDTVEVCSSDDEYVPCSFYTDACTRFSETDKEDSSMDQDETQSMQDTFYTAMLNVQCRNFNRLYEENALTCVQLVLGQPWYAVDTEGEISASFEWLPRSRKDPVTTEEHKSHFALCCGLQGVKTELAPNARFGRLFWHVDSIRCVSLGRGRSNVILHENTRIPGPRESSMLRRMFTGVSSHYCASACADQMHTDLDYRQPSSDEEGSC